MIILCILDFNVTNTLAYYDIFFKNRMGLTQTLYEDPMTIIKVWVLYQLKA
jgi:hypothetical protein